MKHFLSLVAALAVTVSMIVSCGDNKSVSFARVDPLEKLLPETTWSHPYSEVEEVAAGEHATFQFALRSYKDLEGLSLSFEALKDDAGNKIESVTIGFVDYIHVGRTTPDPGRDAIRSLSGMYPDRSRPKSRAGYLLRRKICCLNCSAAYLYFKEHARILSAFKKFREFFLSNNLITGFSTLPILSIVIHFKNVCQV